MNEQKSKIFEYTEKHAGEYIDQFLKIIKAQHMSQL